MLARTYLSIRDDRLGQNRCIDQTAAIVDKWTEIERSFCKKTPLFSGYEDKCNVLINYVTSNNFIIFIILLFLRI